MTPRYTAPRNPLLHWLVSSPGAGDAEKQSWLIGNLFTRTASLVAAAVSELIVALTAIILHGTRWYFVWAGAGVVLLAWRLGIIAVARRRLAAGAATPTGWLAASSLVWAAELGLGGLLCNVSGDPVLQLLSTACTCSVVAGLSARNASTPRLAIAQISLSMGLLCMGAAIAPQLWLKVLLIQAPFFVLGLSSVCLRAGRDLVSMLDAQHRNAALARHDSLTGLCNRTSLNEALCALLPPHAERVFALVWIDLDGFKAVNDALGHAAGDSVLVETARRLEAACAPAQGLVARLGGDEFLVVVPEAGGDEAHALAKLIAAAIRLPHELANAPDVRLDASIGIALHPGHGDDPDALLAAADKALYAAKASGKARAQVYDPLLHAGEDDVIRFRSDLARALSPDRLGHGRCELELYYQPITRLSDGVLVGREALVRWRHPVRGLVSPVAFVPMAEASGLILPLGEWVLQRACADAALWADKARVAVNVSPIQLRAENFISLVVQALDRAGLPPERLEVEVTETVLLSRDETTTCNMQQLRELGIEVALDDFGTGFSSLSNLCSFVFDRIKIDGSFIRGALDRRDCAAVVHATVALARHLGVPTTAECVETQEQLDFVRACGCSEVQGYLLGRPVAAENVADRWREPVPVA